jgi:hypothetical protein
MFKHFEAEKIIVCWHSKTSGKAEALLWQMPQALTQAHFY